MQPQNDVERTKLLLMAKMEVAFKVSLDATFSFLSLPFSKPLKGIIQFSGADFEGRKLLLKKSAGVLHC